MPIDFLLPKLFKPDIKTVIEHQHTRKIRRCNQLYSTISGLVAAICYIIAIAIGNTNEQVKVALLKIFLLMMAAGVFTVISAYAGSKVSNTLKPNYFQIKQTSFYIAISNKELELLIKYYLHSTAINSGLDFDHYNIYVDIYDEVIDDTTKYLLGQMNNGQIMAVDNYMSDYKPATTDMVTTINSYALYIKKHHLEKKFADSATLRYSAKYLDKDYKPMLVMTNKSGAILHLKQNSNINAENVVFTN